MQSLSEYTNEQLEFEELLTEGLDIQSNNQLITAIVRMCKKSKSFISKILDYLNTGFDDSITESLDDEIILESRSWLWAITSNALLYFAFIQVSKISNRWIRTLLIALIAERVITTNQLGKHLRNLIR